MSYASIALAAITGAAWLLDRRRQLVTDGLRVASDEQNTKAMGPEVIVPVAMFAVIFGCVYLGVTAKHKQRMAMIEKGMDPSLFKERTVPMRGLRNGMVLLAVGIGLMLGRVAEPMFHRSPDEDNPLPYFVCVLVCAGLALITHHFIVRKEQQP